MRRHASQEAPRPFGTAEADLSLDFERLARHELTQSVLSLCLGQEAAVRDRELGERIERILRIATAGTDGRFAVRPSCQACGTAIEVSFTVNELADLRAESLSIPRELTVEGVKMRFRLPTGEDQMRWTRMHTGADQGLRPRIARELLVDPEPATAALLENDSSEALARLEERIGEADPLVDFEFSSACPQCGAIGRFSVDLEREGLLLIAGIQEKLINDIQRLASKFHWNEQEILAIPAWRRAKYLQQISNDQWPEEGF